GGRRTDRAAGSAGLADLLEERLDDPHVLGVVLGERALVLLLADLLRLGVTVQHERRTRALRDDVEGTVPPAARVQPVGTHVLDEELRFGYRRGGEIEID